MPDAVAPGVYVEEAPAGARVIAGVPTSTAAFLGATQAGPVAAPLLVHSFAEFEAQFGGLAAEMPLGYAVQQYFVNGGRDALIARIVPSGPTLTDADLSSPALEAQKRGIWLLDHAEHFNILCIPPLTRTTDVGRATWDAAVAYAVRRRAIVIVDPPAAWTGAPTMPEVTALLARSPNAALSDAQLSALNATGVNGLRVLSGAVVLWGARTLAGDDVADPFKFVPLRRLDLFIEESITRGLQGTVFEPNGPSLWERIRTSVEDFLLGLFRQGALQGDKPQAAFFVRCDASTMTQQDIDQGILILVIGVALLKPAEFVIIGIGSRAQDQPCASFVSRHYRIRTARYALRVMWDGATIAGVRRVRGLGQLTELVSVRDGGDPNASRVVVGPTKFEPVTIERGITRDDAFEKWAQAMRQGAGGAPRKDVRIELHDGERRLTVAWVLKGALPVKIEAPDLNADSNDVAIEQLTLAYEGLEFDDNPPC